MNCGLEFYIKRVRVRFTFGFFAVWAALMTQSAFSDIAAAAMVCCLLHETGHIIAMGLAGIRVRSLIFHSGGILMKSSLPTELAGTAAELFILSAGCAVNLILYLCAKAAGLGIIAGINLSLMLFNLLPFSYLDGGRIAAVLLRAVCPEETVARAMGITDTLLGICAAVFFFMSGSMSFTLPLTMGLIILEGVYADSPAREYNS